jgi:hypothetical protein
MADLILLSMENWDGIWRRNQFPVRGPRPASPRPQDPVRGRDPQRKRAGGPFLETLQARPEYPNTTVTRPPWDSSVCLRVTKAIEVWHATTWDVQVAKCATTSSGRTWDYAQASGGIA